jgi:hypothetical protein
MRTELVPSEPEIFGWIEGVFTRGVRRPGYPADRLTEQDCLEQFRALGLEQVRLEPVTLPYWEPIETSLVARGTNDEWHIPCFALPHAAATDGLEAELALWRDDAPEHVRDKAALVEVPLMRVPPAFAAMAGARGNTPDAGRDPAWRCYDPADTFNGATHVLPFNQRIMGVMDPAMAAGAAAFIGVLSDYPGNSYQYYVPYDAVARNLPGVWISQSEGERLGRLCAEGSVHVRLVSRTRREPINSYNVVGELAGADDEVAIIGSHHDGPWASAVEDGSGIALVLAQATYWSRVPAAERSHRLCFLLNAGHMAGGAGVHQFIDAHRERLARVVLEVHLEHAANEVIERDGNLECTGHPEPRWWFTSRNPALEATVREAIVAELLDRSLILPPDVFGPSPTTDGGPFHLAGVPLVNFLSAPFYLFDAIDTLDKIHRPSLVPITRAAIRIIESTRGVTAAAMRTACSDRP